jgi:hypothetical protein
MEQDKEPDFLDETIVECKFADLEELPFYKQHLHDAIAAVGLDNYREIRRFNVYIFGHKTDSFLHDLTHQFTGLQDLSAFKGLHLSILHVRAFAELIARKPFVIKPLTGRLDERYLAVISVFRNGQFPAAHQLPYQMELVKEAFQLDWFEVNHFRQDSDTHKLLPLTSINDFAPATRARREDGFSNMDSKETMLHKVRL